MKKKTVFISAAGAAVLLAAFAALGYQYTVLDSRFQTLETQAAQLQESNSSLNSQLKAASVQLKENMSQLEDNASKLEEQEEYMEGQKDYISQLSEQIDSFTEGDTDGEDGGEAWEYDPSQDAYPDLYAATKEDAPKVGTKYVYLTFDDGPSPLTPKVLDLLDEYNAKATFFVVQKNNEEYEEYLSEIVKRGHVLALHSYSHNYNEIYRSVDAFLADYEKVYDWVKEKTGYTPSLFRFPGGSNNGSSYVGHQIIKEMTRRGFTYFDWSVSSGDGSNLTTTQNIIDNICTHVGTVELPIVLMHDGSGKEATLAALPSVLKYLSEEGYEFRSLDQYVEPVQFRKASSME